eukprot:197907-Amphidinium_carterae.2
MEQSMVPMCIDLLGVLVKDRESQHPDPLVAPATLSHGHQCTALIGAPNSDGPLTTIQRSTRYAAHAPCPIFIYRIHIEHYKSTAFAD